MTDPKVGRRDFIKTAVVGGAAAATTAGGIAPPGAQAQEQPANAAAAQTPEPNDGYSFLNLEEAAFVEALVDHMVPEDEFTPKGTDVGVNIFIDRALAGAWGKGDRLYRSGPWREGVPAQGYQLPLTPAELYREGIKLTNAHCTTTYGRSFDRLDAAQREEVLIALSAREIDFGSEAVAREFWSILYQTVMEGMFSDPIYGGNRNKVGWRMIGFPGVIGFNRENVKNYLDRELPGDPVSIEDMS
ncbi:MAG: gluconate 2-dehydrogenase subunit 3 family protein [Micropepsaceae bacterium]